MFHRLLDIFHIVIILVIFVLFVNRLHLHSDPTQPILQHKSRLGISVNVSSPRSTTPDAFYQTIIEYNLFRPFGWRLSVPDPQYELLGTTISHRPEHTKATIRDTRSDRLYIQSRRTGW